MTKAIECIKIGEKYYLISDFQRMLDTRMKSFEAEDLEVDE